MPTTRRRNARTDHAAVSSSASHDEDSVEVSELSL